MSKLSKFARTKFGFEKLEERINPDVTFGWEIDGSNLYFRIDGDASVNTATLSVNANGDTNWKMTYVEDGDTLELTGSVTSGEIATNAFLWGYTWSGFHLVTGDGNDVITSTTNQKVWAQTGNGDDSITTGQGADTIDAGAGNDTVNSGAGRDNISGGAGNDVLNGQSGNDTIAGNDGHDHIIGGTGADNMSGGQGSDQIHVDNAGDVASGGTGGENFDATPPNTVVPEYGNSVNNVGDELILEVGRSINNSDFEWVFGTSGNDTVNSSTFVAGGDFAGKGTVVLGNAGNDVLTGSAFADTLSGGDGDDTLEGLAGGDNLDGGNGLDTVSYANSPVGVVVDLGNTPQLASGGHATGDTIANFENVTGSADDDELYGSNGANVMNGGAGDDYIVGAGGADTINGGDGDDTVEAGGGNDTVDGGNGDDDLDGGSGNDTMNGGNGNDQLLGGLGADILDGNLGNDLVDGGAGNDTLRVNWDNATALDRFFGGDQSGVGVDTFLFYGVTFDDGDDDIAGNADDNPDEAEVALIMAYIDDQVDLNRSDWDATGDIVAFAR